MNKKELIDAVNEAVVQNTGGKAPDQKTLKAARMHTEAILEAFANVTAAELLGGGEITIQGVGKLKTKPVCARTGHNPQTGEVLEIPAGKKIVFAPFRDFRDALRGDMA